MGTGGGEDEKALSFINLKLFYFYNLIFSTNLRRCYCLWSFSCDTGFIKFILVLKGSSVLLLVN